MPSTPHPQSRIDESSPKNPTPAESADYTYDLLISLKKLAVDHNQTRLARLIEAAAMEAQFLTGQGLGADDPP
ncbi:MAG TPA: hypothetical protein VGM72_02140 [Micropepsaceae bacterium]|jgi:hypothetical protein